MNEAQTYLNTFLSRPNVSDTLETLVEFLNRDGLFMICEPGKGFSRWTFEDGSRIDIGGGRFRVVFDHSDLIITNKTNVITCMNHMTSYLVSKKARGVNEFIDQGFATGYDATNEKCIADYLDFNRYIP